MNTARAERVSLSVRARPLTLPAAVESYRDYALPRFYSLGAGKKFFMGTALIAWAAGGLSIALGAALFAVGKIIGKIHERFSVKQVANLVKTDEDKLALRQKMQELSPPLQDKLTKQLGKRGVVI